MKTNEDAEFMVNEFLEGPREDLKEIVNIVERKPMRYDRKAVFLKEFTFGLFEAYRRQKFIEVQKALEVKKPVETKKEEKIEIKKIEKPIIELPLPPTPKPKFFEDYRNIIIGSKGQVFAKSIYKNGIYNLEEPKIDVNWSNLLDSLKKEIGGKILKKRSLVEDTEFIKKNVLKLCKKLKINYSDEVFDGLRYYFIRDLVNLGKVDALVKDDFIREIICDGAGKNVVVNYKGNEVNSNIIFSNDNEVDSIIKKVAERARQKVDLEYPFLNVVLGNLRVQGNLKSGLSGARFIIKKI